jgi:hypothetical protein
MHVSAHVAGSVASLSRCMNGLGVRVTGPGKGLGGVRL